MKQDLELYYTAPADEIFEEVRQASIAIWKTYDNEHGYVDSKVDQIRDIENIKDNMMFMVAMFDIYNQEKLLSSVSEKARLAIEDRLPENYFLENSVFARIIGL